MKILVTGAAGFIGYHVACAFLDRGDDVVGLDNLNAYYDPGLKESRLERLRRRCGFVFARGALEDREATENLFSAHRFDRVVHLAAQAGVRYSLRDPHAYVSSNLTGFLHILEGCRRGEVGHLVYASSSSVYGANRALPYSVHDNVDHPLSLYAATKKSNELMAHAYAHLYRMPTTGLRFFTVYGPWGRPDMSPHLFTSRILAGETVDVFNHGRHSRDFTYIDDIVEGVMRVSDRPAEADASWSGESPDPATSLAPYRIYNIGNNRPVDLMRFIGCIEQAVGRKARINFLPMQPGDVEATCADIDDLSRDVGFAPRTPIEDGVRSFVEWHRAYYRV
jgi:UDP-glucuronate 4-epimerase